MWSTLNSAPSSDKLSGYDSTPTTYTSKRTYVRGVLQQPKHSLKYTISTLSLDPGGLHTKLSYGTRSIGVNVVVHSRAEGGVTGLR
jgi:hypothetical protein